MFTPSGKNIAKPMITIQVQQGKMNIVAPDEMKTKDLRYPIPWSEISAASTMVISTFLIVCLSVLILW